MNNLVRSLVYVFLGLLFIILGVLMKVMEFTVSNLDGNTVMLIGLVLTVVAIGFSSYFAIQQSKNKKP